MQNTYAVNLKTSPDQPERTFVVKAGDAAEARAKARKVVEREGVAKGVKIVDVIHISL